MNVLSIHSAGHDTAASYFIDGRLIFSIETERLTRSKHDHRSEIALSHCLSRVQRGGYRTDLVVSSLPLRNTILKIPDAERAVRFLEEGRLHYETKSYIFGEPIDCVVVLHEASHAALAAHYAGYQEGCLVLVNEGKGQISRSSLYVIDGGRLRLVELDPLPWYATGYGWTAIGYLYGFGIGPQIAGKLMAVGGYGEPSEYVRSVLSEISDSVMHDRTGAEKVARKLKSDINFVNDFRSMADVIATLQHMFTEKVADLVKRHLGKHGDRALALGGGCALNLPTNTALRQCLRRDISIPPACNDAGQALGAGVYAQAFLLGMQVHPFSVYSNGLAEDRDTVLEIARSRGLRVSTYDPRPVARELTRGAIVAFLGGQSEIGPRALGARSILANPSIPGMRKRVSEQIKGREWYRPLGAAMRLERFCEAFPQQYPSPYMLFAYSPNLGLFPEATHVDGSSRIQTVRKEDCPALHELLQEFETHSGQSALINTSLNGPGKAIAYTLSHALDDFLHTDVDLFVFDELMAANVRPQHREL